MHVDSELRPHVVLLAALDAPGDLGPLDQTLKCPLPRDGKSRSSECSRSCEGTSDHIRSGMAVSLVYKVDRPQFCHVDRPCSQRPSSSNRPLRHLTRGTSSAHTPAPEVPPPTTVKKGWPLVDRSFDRLPLLHSVKLKETASNTSVVWNAAPSSAAWWPCAVMTSSRSRIHVDTLRCQAFDLLTRRPAWSAGNSGHSRCSRTTDRTRSRSLSRSMRQQRASGGGGTVRDGVVLWRRGTAFRTSRPAARPPDNAVTARRWSEPADVPCCNASRDALELDRPLANQRCCRGNASCARSAHECGHEDDRKSTRRTLRADGRCDGARAPSPTQVVAPGFNRLAMGSYGTDLRTRAATDRGFVRRARRGAIARAQTACGRLQGQQARSHGAHSFRREMALTRLGATVRDLAGWMAPRCELLLIERKQHAWQSPSIAASRFPRLGGSSSIRGQRVSGTSVVRTPNRRGSSSCRNENSLYPAATATGEFAVHAQRVPDRSLFAQLFLKLCTSPGRWVRPVRCDHTGLHGPLGPSAFPPLAASRVRQPSLWDQTMARKATPSLVVPSPLGGDFRGRALHDVDARLFGTAKAGSWGSRTWRHGQRRGDHSAALARVQPAALRLRGVG